MKNLKKLLICCVLPVILTACMLTLTPFTSSAADNRQFLFTTSAAMSGFTGVTRATATFNSTERCAQLTASSAANDPFVSFNVEAASSTPVSADTYKYVVLTYKCPTTNSSVSTETQVFFCSGSVTGAAEASSIKFNNTKNGTYVYKVFDLSAASYWSGTVHSLRIDFFSICKANDTMFLDSITFCDSSAAANAAGTYRAGRANGTIAAENFSVVFDNASKLSYVEIEESAALAGDVNGDNAVNTLDSFMLKRLLAGLGSATSIADVNADGHLSARDSLLLRKYLAELVQTLPEAKATSAVKEYDSETESAKITSMSTNPIIYINLADEDVSAADLKYAAITYMTPASSAAGQSKFAFVPSGSTAASCAKQTVALTRDGDFHNAIIDLSAVAGWTGKADGISIELFTACNIGDIYSIDSIILAETESEANDFAYQRYLEANNIPMTTVEKLDVSAQTLGRINTQSSKANFGYWALGTAQSNDYLMPYSTTWAAAGFTASASRDTLMAFMNYNNYVKVSDCIDLSQYSQITITYGTHSTFAATSSEFGFFSQAHAYGQGGTKNTAGLLISAPLSNATGNWTTMRTATVAVNSTYCGPLFMSLYMSTGDGAVVTDITFTLKEPKSSVETDPVNNVDGTPAYTVSGDGNYIIANGVTYPNKLNYTSGATVGTDDLDRTLSTTADLDVPTFTNDNGDVGIFYFLWLGNHGDVSGRVFDISKILAAGGEAAKKSTYSGWGPENYMHFFYEPLYGYYYSSDQWVIRKHVEELINANVDFLYFDTTNGPTYSANAIKVMQMLHEYNLMGYDAPEVVFYTNTNPASTVQNIYNEIYAAHPELADTWYYLEGRPAIVSIEDTCRSTLPSNIYNFFTFRESQWPTGAAKTNAWPWILDFGTKSQVVYYNDSGKKESISVGVAAHCTSQAFCEPAIYGNYLYTNSNPNKIDHGRSWNAHTKALTLLDSNSYKYGYNIQEQWDYAISQDVPIVLVTGWNEWVAGRLDKATCLATGRAADAVLFVDTCSLEYSRDIEMTRGAYFDNYYMQLIDNVRRYKGSAPTLIQTAMKRIDTTGSFAQWNDVTAIYRDGIGDTAARNNQGFGMYTLTNSTGRNDLKTGKVIHDTEYLYFYVDTQSTISTYSTNSSWMQLFIDVDSNGNTGWYGYDYIANYDAKTDRITSLAQSQSNDSYNYTEVCELNYQVSGKMLMLRVPLSSLGITDADDIDIQFKWADSNTNITTMEQMYTDGDTMPHGRPNYEYKVG